jgi:hypothetical protein
MGLVPDQLQARLAIGEIQTAGRPTDNNKDRARVALESLARDARQSNYELISRKAQALLSAKPAH